MVLILLTDPERKERQIGDGQLNHFFGRRGGATAELCLGLFLRFGLFYTRIKTQRLLIVLKIETLGNKVQANLGKWINVL